MLKSLLLSTIKYCQMILYILLHVMLSLYIINLLVKFARYLFLEAIASLVVTISITHSLCRVTKVQFSASFVTTSPRPIPIKNSSFLEAIASLQVTFSLTHSLTHKLALVRKRSKHYTRG